MQRLRFAIPNSSGQTFAHLRYVRYSRHRNSACERAVCASRARTANGKDHAPHARGTFTVDIRPLTPPIAEGIGRFSTEKKLAGDLEGSTKGEMLSGGNPKLGAAGYVAMELFTGTLGGKHGSFALQHTATMDDAGRNMSVIVVPGSGTQNLKGIAGKFSIEIANGQHSYDLEYTLP